MVNFLEWLIEVLDEQREPSNAYWLDRNAQIFAVRWVHAKSPLWVPQCDDLFKLWRAEGPRTWCSDGAENRAKINFRMNLSSSNFVQLTKKGATDRGFPVQIFKINNASEVSKATRAKREIRKFRKKRQASYRNEYENPNSWTSSRPDQMTWKAARIENPNILKPEFNVNNQYSFPRSSTGTPCYNGKDTTTQLEHSLVSTIFENQNNFSPCEDLDKFILKHIPDINISSYPTCMHEIMPKTRSDKLDLLPESYTPTSSRYTQVNTNYNPVIDQDLTVTELSFDKNTCGSMSEGSSFYTNEWLNQDLVCSPIDSSFAERASFSSIWDQSFDESHFLNDFCIDSVFEHETNNAFYN